MKKEEFKKYIQQAYDKGYKDGMRRGIFEQELEYLRLACMM